MQKPFFFLLVFVGAGSSAWADSLYVRKIVNELCSSSYFGRGYVNNGMQKAAEFIAAEMSKSGLAVQQQKFEYPVNFFPGKMRLLINGNELKPGTDFLVQANSGGCKGKGVLEAADSVTYINRPNRVLIQKTSKLTWTVAGEQNDFTALQLLNPAEAPVTYECNIENGFNKHFKASNVAGVIKGSVQPDSFIVYTAHYDHLGGMGSETYFPGANDNAGGVAVLLDLVKYYAKNPPPYSILFIAFAGEEAGLIGSKYFTEHPLIALKKITFLINLDLVGTGDEGMTVVNAAEYPAAFQLLQDINRQKHLISNIYSRGKAANSDHYWFTEKGVPSFFIYTMGKRKDYHDVNDIASTLPLMEVNDLEELLFSFTDKLMQH